MFSADSLIVSWSVFKSAKYISNKCDVKGSIVHGHCHQLNHCEICHGAFHLCAEQRIRRSILRSFVGFTLSMVSDNQGGEKGK